MKQLCKIFAVLTICAVGAMPAMAETDSCSHEKNNLIHPTLALCSTHAYNVKTASNPGHNYSNDSDRQNQRDVIALKTTVITQQMKQQYDYLNSTIKRLKNQLQKAVLTTSLEAAGASSESTSSSYVSNNRNIILAGAQDCDAMTSKSAVLDCIQSNVVHIRAAANSGNKNEAFKQLKHDLEIAGNWNVKTNKDSGCGDVTNDKKSTDSLTKCISALNVAIIQERDNQNSANMQLDALKSVFGK